MPAPQATGAAAKAAEKQEVKGYFETTGFERWNRIYSDSEAVNRVQRNIRIGHQKTVDEVLRWQATLGERPVNGDWTPFSFARSAACGFGWDWGPRVPGVGFYGARFDCWSATRITGVSVSQRWNADGTVTVRVEPQGEFDRSRLVCIVREREGAMRVECDARGEATIRAPRLWTTWDRGSNAGAWWNAMVGVRDERGAFKPIATSRFALRRVELDSSPDSVGRRFRFILNGEPLFARGANLIPPPLGARHEFDWFAEMRRYRATGFNMVRVWGGGNYLPDGFYEACDELGILVWQDFMFACATYPEDDPMPALVAREAREQVARLCAHPSIVLWCGGNEDVLAWQGWGFRERLAPGQSWGIRYWQEILPGACAELDPTRPYWVDSPWSGSLERHANDPDHGDRHTWDLKLDGCRGLVPRFTSEFGHQSPPPPSLATLREEFPEPLLAAGSDALRLRQKAWGGDDAQYKPYLAARFADARDAREYVAQAQLLQARAMDVAMRWLRAGAPRSMGALIWQWNDVWAGHSWSLVDVAGRAKPAWHAVRRACAPRMLTIEPVDGRPQVVLCDDRAFGGADCLGATAVVERVDFLGRVRGGAPVALVPHEECGLPAATARGAVPESLLAGADPARELLVAWIPDEPDLPRAHWFLAEDAELALPPPALERGAEGRMRANRLIREFWIEGDHDLAPGDSWRTLLPGDEVVLAAGARWWSANHFAKIDG